MSIPRIIHQTAQDWKSLNEDFKNNIKDLREKNPNWNYKFYDKSDRVQYIENNFPDLLTFYKAINPKFGAAQADFFRYCVLYNEGGVYLDIKSNVNRSLDDIINKEDEFVWQSGASRDWKMRNYEGIRYEIMQWFICTKAKHPFLWNVLEAIQEEMQKEKYLGNSTRVSVLDLTGPDIYSKTIYKLMDSNNSYKHRQLDDSNEDFLYNPQNIYYSRSIKRVQYVDLREPVLLYKPNLVEKFTTFSFSVSPIGIM